MISAVSTTNKGLSSPPALFDKGWVPKGYTGPVALPGTGRIVYWTGRIAIGLRYAPNAPRQTDD
ncbi:MAG TPA: hypothetical protein VF457_04430 [Burkholderiaceae bacterium]